MNSISTPLSSSIFGKSFESLSEAKKKNTNTESLATSFNIRFNQNLI